MSRLVKDLYDAIRMRNNKQVDAIMESNPSILDTHAPIGTWLHVAANNGNIEVVNKLICLGLDVNAIDSALKYKPIWLAAAEGHIDVVRRLIDEGATFDVADPGINPLYAAIQNNHVDVVELLLDNGIGDNEGYDAKSAVSFAQRFGRSEIAGVLRSFHGLDDAEVAPETKAPSIEQDKVLVHLKEHFEEVADLSLSEILGDIVIHIIPPSPLRNFYLLATSGSKLHNELDNYELLLYLPATWNLDDLSDPKNYWPIGWLRKVAHFESSVSPENTFSNEEEFEPLGPNTKMSGFMILYEMEDYGLIDDRHGKTTRFLILIPLYKEEVQLKRKRGLRELLERFEAFDISLVLDIDRPNVGKIE